MTIVLPKPGHKPGHLIYTFPNGFGASVISDGYGKDEGLYELAVLDSEGHITYQTPLTSDVLGYLTQEDVERHLGEIAALTPEVIAAEARKRLLAEADELRERAANLIAKADALIATSSDSASS